MSKVTELRSEGMNRLVAAKESLGNVRKEVWKKGACSNMAYVIETLNDAFDQIIHAEIALHKEGRERELVEERIQALASKKGQVQRTLLDEVLKAHFPPKK